MPRPRKGTEETFYDTFADWKADDQAAALRVLEQIHRQTQRAERRAASVRGSGASPEPEPGEADAPMLELEG